MVLKKQPILSIEKILDLDYIKFMLTVAASSCRFGKIILHEKNDTLVEIRGTTHCIIVSPFGTGKSTTIFKINNVKIHKANDITMPGLIGTITKDGQALIGAVFRAGGKVLLIDEAQRIDDSTKNAMNAILEFPHETTRAIGHKVNQYVKLKGYNALVTASENEMKVYSKFSCIASTTYIKLKNSIDTAWLSRFIPIRLQPDSEYMERMLGGETVYEISALDMKADFDFPNYMEFHKYYFDNYKKSKWFDIIEQRKSWVGVLSRNLGDIIRIAAYLTVLDGGRTTIKTETAKLVFDRFFDQMMYNLLIGPLNPTEYEVLVNCTLSYDRIAQKLNIHEKSVSRIMRDLENRGLVQVEKIVKEKEKVQLPERDWIKPPIAENL